MASLFNNILIPVDPSDHTALDVKPDMVFVNTEAATKISNLTAKDTNGSLR